MKKKNSQRASAAAAPAVFMHRNRARSVPDERVCAFPLKVFCSENTLFDRAEPDGELLLAVLLVSFYLFNYIFLFFGQFPAGVCSWYLLYIFLYLFYVENNQQYIRVPLWHKMK